MDIASLRRYMSKWIKPSPPPMDWNDLDLGHSVRETKLGKRYTISETARREILDHLLALNHQRHAEEAAEEIAFAAKVKTNYQARSEAKNDGGSAQ